MSRLGAGRVAPSAASAALALSLSTACRTVTTVTNVYIGGGAAGYFAAINAAERHPHIHHVLLEATSNPMSKIKVSGGGRCNVTHNCFEARRLASNYPRGHRELMGIFARFAPQDTIEWFRRRGVRLVAEADGRMFPSSNSSDEIVRCFTAEAQRLGVTVLTRAKVVGLRRVQAGEGQEQEGFEVEYAVRDRGRGGDRGAGAGAGAVGGAGGGGGGGTVTLSAHLRQCY